MIDDKILTWDEFVSAGFDSRDYRFPEKDGLYWGTLDAKRWGKPKDSAIVYFTDDMDGKFMAFVWKSQRYLNINNFHNGERIVLTFKTNSKGYNSLVDIQKA